MKKTSSYRQKKSRARAQHKADRRRAAHQSAPTAARQPVMWLGSRRPAIAPKSNELILVRLEHQKDESKRIAPRLERGMKVLAMNGRVVQQRRDVA